MIKGLSDENFYVFFSNKLKKNNLGSAVVEATLVIPVFLFAVLALYNMCRCKLAEGVIYEAASETAEYMAEYSYIGDPDMFIPALLMPQYIDNEELVNTCVLGGINGINYLGTVTRDSDDYVVLKVNYTLNVDVPFMPFLSKNKQISIRQRCYIGEGAENGKSKCNNEDRYVYVTDNKEVYHDSRNCTHLDLSVYETSIVQAQNHGYTACEFCGDKCGTTVFVTNEGVRFHSSKLCSGLKRTVYRVKFSDVSGLPGCSRCVE